MIILAEIITGVSWLDSILWGLIWLLPICGALMVPALVFKKPEITLSICRVIVGSLFIISGLIKANDTLGFSYKLVEYFDIFGMSFFNEIAVGIAMFICVAEILLGVACLIGAKMKLVSALLLILIIFFTGLTFYSEYSGKVTDCGCFGDALKLTPYQSYIKDIILLAFVVPLVIWRKEIKFSVWNDNKVVILTSLALIILFSILQFNWYFPVIFTLVCIATAMGLDRIREKSEWLIAGAVGLLSLLFSVYTFKHLPIKDYRVYKVGNNIQQERDSAKPPVVEIMFTYRNLDTGEIRKLATNELTQIDLNNWEMLDREDVLVSEGTQKVNDFNVERSTLELKPEEEKYLYTDAGRYESLMLLWSNPNEEKYEKVAAEDISYLKDEISRVDYVDFYLQHPKNVFFYVSYDVNKADKEVQVKMKTLANEVQKNGDVFIGITASIDGDVEEFRHNHGLAFDFYSMDEKALKTIVRSNPGLIYLRQGTIVAKWHYNDVPTYEELKTNYLID